MQTYGMRSVIGLAKWRGAPGVPTGAGAQRRSSRNNYDSQFDRVITKAWFDELKKLLREKGA